jgi:hypothetical protein
MSSLMTLLLRTSQTLICVVESGNCFATNCLSELENLLNCVIRGYASKPHLQVNSIGIEGN